MAGFDGKSFGTEIVGVVKEYLAREIGGVAKRIDDIEQRLGSLPGPKDGKDADEDAIVARVSEKMATELADLRGIVESIEIPEIPQIPELPDIGKMVEEAIQKQMAVDDLEHSLEELVKFAVDAIPAPKDGTSVTVDDVAPMIASEVEKWVSALPKPKDGRDGLDVKELFRAEGGKLVAVMSDGTIRDLGVFVGKDGQDADMAAIEKSIAEKFDAIPRPKDGKDGFSLEDFEVHYDGEKTITLMLKSKDIVKEFSFVMPVVIDKGVYSEGKTYAPGDGVTWGGSFWIAQEETTAKPDGGKSWRLAVKKGRDGRDGTMKPDNGPPKVKI